MIIRAKSGTREVEGVEISIGRWSYSPVKFGEFMMNNKPPNTIVALGGTLLIITLPEPQNQFERAEIFIHMVKEYFKEMFGNSVLDSVEILDATDNEKNSSYEENVIY
jgi:hypothetical protein